MQIRTVAMIISLFAAFILRAASAEITSIPQIGPHHPIFILEKNVNPQNIMVIYTKEDANGHFLTDAADPTRPIFDFYWLMDGKNYKPVNGMIKSEIGKRFEWQLSRTNPKTHFIVNLNDLKEVDSDIKDPKIDVYASRSGGTRGAEAQMTLGPSNGNMRIKITSIYTEGRAFPPAVYCVALKGEEIVDGKLTGKKVTRRYDAKK
jgi:hypothetical protein